MNRKSWPMHKWSTFLTSNPSDGVICGISIAPWNWGGINRGQWRRVCFSVFYRGCSGAALTLECGRGELLFSLCMGMNAGVLPSHFVSLPVTWFSILWYRWWEHLSLLILEEICKVCTRSPSVFYYNSMLLWPGIEGVYVAPHCCDNICSFSWKLQLG